MLTPNTPRSEATPDQVAEFISMLRQACADAGTIPPSWVGNHKPGDTVLRDSPSQAYPVTHRHWRNAGLTYQRQQPPRATADYEYDLTDDNIIVIIDLDLGNKSVTNDLRNVLADIAVQRNLVSLADYLVLYRDSKQHWDEVLFTESGRPVARSNGGSSEAAALDILRTYYGR